MQKLVRKSGRKSGEAALVTNGETLGEHLARLRGVDRSLDEVMRAAWSLGYDITARAIGKIENGESLKPDRHTLKALARVYKVSYLDLLARAGHKATPEEIEVEEYLTDLRHLPEEQREDVRTVAREQHLSE